MKQYKRFRENMKESIKEAGLLAKVAVGPLIVASALFTSMSFLPSLEGKFFPYKQGGLPTPFMTRLVDDNGDKIPDRTLLYSIGPGYFNGQEREPTQREIEWYGSQE